MRTPRFPLLLILALGLGIPAPAHARPPAAKPAAKAAGGLRAQAEAHLAAGRFREAREAFEKVVSSNPGDARAQLQLGLLYEREGKAARAIEAYERGFRQPPPGFDRLRVNLAALYNLAGQPEKAIGLLDGRVADADRDATAHLVLGSAWLASGNPEKAMARFRIVRALEPGSLRGKLAEGSALRALGRHDESLKLLEGTVRDHPADPSAHFQLAETLAAGGKHARALGHYRKAEAGGDAAAVRRRMADVLVAMKDHAGAIPILEGLRRESPSDAGLAAALAAAYEGAGRPGDSEKVLRDLVSRSPRSAAGHFRLGVVLGIRDRHAEAAAQFRKALALSPDDPSILRALAVACRRAGDLAGAEDAARRWLRLRPDDVDATAMTAALLRDRGKGGEAVALYRSFVSRRPSDSAALADLAELLDESGKGAEALEFARRAVAAGPSDATANDRLGWILLRRGDKAAALPHLEKAARLAPGEPAVLYHYAEALYRNGRPKEARAAVERALSGGMDFPGSRDAAALRKRLVDPGRF